MDYEKLLTFLREKYSVKMAFLFLGYLEENKNLYEFLTRIGYTIIFKPVLRLNNGKIKGNIDAELVLHCMIEFEHFDKALIITEDGDFYCLVNYLNQQNKLLRLLVPNQYKYSSLLRKFRSNTDYMNNMHTKLKL